MVGYWNSDWLLDDKYGIAINRDFRPVQNSSFLLHCHWLRWTIQLLREIRPVTFRMATSNSVYRLCMVWAHLWKPRRLTFSHRIQVRLTDFQFGGTGFQFVSTGKSVSQTSWTWSLYKKVSCHGFSHAGLHKKRTYTYSGISCLYWVHLSWTMRSYAQGTCNF